MQVHFGDQMLIANPSNLLKWKDDHGRKHPFRLVSPFQIEKYVRNSCSKFSKENLAMVIYDFFCLKKRVLV